MARKTVTERWPSKRALAALWFARREAGSDAELIRWLKDYPAPPRGRPRNTFFDELVATAAEFYGPAWNVDRKRAIARLKDRGVKPPKGGFKFMTPHQTLREYVTAVWQNHEEMSRNARSPAEREAWSPRH